MQKVLVTDEWRMLPTHASMPAEELPMFAENRVHQRSSGNPYPCKIVAQVDRQHREERPFRPHLTIGRMKAGRRIEGLDKAIEEHKGFAAGTFMATEMVLFRSDLKPTGPVYTPLAKFKLGV